MRGTASRVAMIGAFASLLIFTVAQADAQRGGGGRGGGASRGGGATSMNRGGGGGGEGFSRGGSYSRPAGGASQLPAGGAQRPGVNPGQRPGAGAGAGQRPTQLPSRGGNVNTGNINTGNVNINRNVNVTNKNYYGHGSGCCWGGWRDYPVGAGIAIGAVAGITAAAIGSAYYALPPACAPYPYSGYTYYRCGNAWYRPQYEGDTIVYITVARPY